MRIARVLLLAVLVAGCVFPRGDDAPLQAASVEGGLAGELRVGDALVVEHARITAAPRDEPARGTTAAPVAPGDAAEARTALARDHWVLEVALRTRAPGGLAAPTRLSLEWNGADAGEIVLGAGEGRARVRFDVGAQLAPSNLYVLTARPLAAP